MAMKSEKTKRCKVTIIVVVLFVIIMVKSSKVLVKEEFKELYDECEDLFLLTFSVLKQRMLLLFILFVFGKLYSGFSVLGTPNFPKVGVVGSISSSLSVACKVGLSPNKRVK